MKSLSAFASNRAVLFSVLVLAVYVPVILFGELTSDDWSVWHLHVLSNGFMDAYHDYFPSFSDRPAAPLYYALTSRFAGNWAAYSIVDIVEWVGAVSIITYVIGGHFGTRVAAIFAAFALLPTLSSTVIFSPAMQSIGAVSVLLWAAGFYILDLAITKKDPVLAAISILPMALMLATYEVAMPLLVFSVLWPLVRSGRPVQEFSQNRIFVINFILSVSAIALMLVYQKLIAPRYFGDISRMRASDSVQFEQLLETNLRALYAIIFTKGPLFMARGLEKLTFHGTLAGVVLWGVAVICFWRIVKTLPEAEAYDRRKGAGLCGVAIGIAILGVGVMHAGALMTPTIKGYTNRGMTSFSILLPLGLAMIFGYLDTTYKSGKIYVVIFLLLFCGYAASFVAQSEDYIAAGQIREKAVSEAIAEMGPDRKVTVLADVPRYFPDNYNDIEIFTDDLSDWALPLILKTQGRLGGAVINRYKVCSKRQRLVIDGDSVVVDGSAPIPLQDVVFYIYGGGSGKSLFLPVHSGNDLKQILNQHEACPHVVKHP